MASPETELYTISGSAPRQNPAAANLALRAVRFFHSSRGNIRTLANVNPIRIQLNKALSHNPSPKQKKPQNRVGRACSAANLTSSNAPATSRKCWKATGPQSKQVVSRNIVSVASNTPPIHAARRLCTVSSNRTKSRIVNVPSSSAGRRTVHEVGAASWKIGAQSQFFSAPSYVKNITGMRL